MNRSSMAVLLSLGVALIVWALMTHGKEGMYLFSAGAGTLLCTLSIVVWRKRGHSRPKTNAQALIGAAAGMVLGGVVGAVSGFGRTMIAVFNPDLPERDFGTAFGAIGGALIGSFGLALLFGLLSKVAERRRAAAAADLRAEIDG